MVMCDYCIHLAACPTLSRLNMKWSLKAVQNGDLYCQFFRPTFMPTISMAWTTPAWVAESKCVTRRHWQPVTIRRFSAGTKYLALKSNYGGDALGVGQITENPYKQETSKMSDEDYVMEGFAYMDNEYLRIAIETPLEKAMRSWQYRNELMTVVPFKILEVFPGMRKKYTTDDEIKRCVKALVKAIG